MKRIKSINGYTIYQATARDESKYDVSEGYFYLFFSSDIRDYGLTNCDWDMECGTIKEAESFATGTNYAIAKEIVEETTTAASFEEIAVVESKLDSGMSREAIESEDNEETTIEAKISNAHQYFSQMKLINPGLDYTSLRNDAANIFSDNYDEYLTIFASLNHTYIKHFHNTDIKCSAMVVDWVELNKLNDKSDDFFQYFGNYMDDDSNSSWAVFGDFPKRYCVLLTK